MERERARHRQTGRASSERQEQATERGPATHWKKFAGELTRRDLPILTWLLIFFDLLLLPSQMLLSLSLFLAACYFCPNFHFFQLLPLQLLPIFLMILILKTKEPDFISRPRTWLALPILSVEANERTKGYI